uniref:Uncharacterized protein n=1 Tax=Setaria italica TaxID=4555 RepID=K3ZG65_SETIT
MGGRRNDCTAAAYGRDYVSPTNLQLSPSTNLPHVLTIGAPHAPINLCIFLFGPQGPALRERRKKSCMYSCMRARISLMIPFTCNAVSRF